MLHHLVWRDRATGPGERPSCPCCSKKREKGGLEGWDAVKEKGADEIFDVQVHNEHGPLQGHCAARQSSSLEAHEAGRHLRHWYHDLAVHGATTNSGADGPPHPGPQVTVCGGVLPASAVCRYAGWTGDGDEDADGLEDQSEEGVR